MDKQIKNNSTEVSEEVSVEVKEEKGHHIILFNDDVNSFEHVIECLVKYCKHNPIQAEQCATIVHYNGKCSVKIGDVDTLLPINNALLENQLSSEIQKC
jgi:ATP-dependent Clp protease adaptor protein ClpS